MARARTLRGELTKTEPPDWTSLEEFIDIELCERFMWMHEVELEDGTTVDAYKDRGTRRYLHLGRDGRAFDYTEDGQYQEIDPCLALLRVFEDTSAYGISDGERAALLDALQRGRPANGRESCPPTKRA